MITAWLAIGVAHGGAWTKDLGSAYVKAGADVYGALRFVDPGSGEEASNSNYLGQQYSVYGEAGLLDAHPVQLSISAPLVVGIHTSRINDALGEVRLRATTTRMGDLRPAVQVALSKKVPLAVAFEAKIPMYANGSVGEEIPTYTPLFPKPGDGNVDFTGWLYGGASPADGTFLEGGAGYQVRTEAFVGWDTDIAYADSVRFVAKAGHVFGPVIPIVSMEGTLSLGGPEDLYTRQFLSAGANALLDVGKGWAIEPRFSAELWARAASQGLGGGLGVSYRR